MMDKRDMKEILRKFWVSGTDILGGVVDNEWTRAISYFCMVFFVLGSMQSEKLALILCVLWIAYFIKKTRESKILKRKKKKKKIEKELFDEN